MSPNKGNNSSNKVPSLIVEDDCERPACADIQSMLRQTHMMTMNDTTTNMKKPSMSKMTKSTPTTTTTNKEDNVQSQSSSSTSSSSIDCPVNTSTLGHATWTLLHSMVAWYPDQPTIQDQRSMKDFFSTLSKFYPCTYCAHDFQEQIVQHPIQVENRETLCIWLCEQHNTVNEKLGKPKFPCTIQQLDERWRKSNHPKCRSNTSLH